MRRIVTGNSSSGKAEFISAGEVVRTGRLPDSKNEFGFCWATTASTSLPHSADDVATSAPMMPAPGGTTFLMLQFAPHFKSAMHSTDTVDYCTLISGEIWLLLDGSEQRLRPGEASSRTARSTPGTTALLETCVMSCVMIATIRQGLDGAQRGATS